MKKFIILVALIVGGLFFYGRSLPREHTIKSTIVIVAPADSVFNVIRRIGNQAKWWSDIRSVRQIVGRRKESWEQNTLTSGLVSLEVTALAPPGKMVTTIIPNEEESEEKMKWGGTWTYSVFEGASGTQVVIIESGWVDPPLYRVFMKLRGQYRTVDSFLTSLAAAFGDVASPRHGDN